MTKVFYAKTKNSRISPRKARLIADLIRGKEVDGLADKLNLMNTKAGKIFANVVKSAAANAVNNYGAEETKLVVAESRVDEGFTIKRGKPVSKGRYHKINKRTSHIVVGLKSV